MIRNKSFIITITTLLTVALLLTMGSRAIPVSALADPVTPYIAPVFDTQIYQLEDYVQNMSDPQYEIFKMLIGTMVISQAGASNYRLQVPDLTTEEGVVGWLKECGLQLYNSLIGFAPDTIIDPLTGNIISTTKSKEMMKYLVANAMGAAVVAANYSTEQDFLDEMEQDEHKFLFFNGDVQTGVNLLIQSHGGFYEWQQVPNPFDNLDFSYTPLTGALADIYAAQQANLTVPHIPYNSSSDTNENIITDYIGDSYLFYNTSTGYAYLTDSNGNARTNRTINVVWYRHSAIFNGIDHRSLNLYFQAYNFQNDSRTYVEITNSLFTRRSLSSICYLDWTEGFNNYLTAYPLYNFFVKGVYVGPSWDNKTEVQNIEDLNFANDPNIYYNQLQSDYLLDIKGIINDLIDTTDLWLPFSDNLFDLNGVEVYDPALIRVTTDIYELLYDNNPPLPVNLNDISLYTENTYLERVKESARNFGDIFANYVFFWHNCDHDIVYIFFGSAVIVLIGAFIGKWGHS